MRKRLNMLQTVEPINQFDPNVRLALWDDIDLLRKRINEFIPKADIVKISDEELEFITGKDSIEDALPQLFTGRVKLVIYTKGSEGAEAYTKSVSASAPAEKVNAIDTTGAGDAFIGSLLYQLAEDGVTTDSIADLTEDKLEEYLKKSNGYCSKKCTGKRSNCILSNITLMCAIYTKNIQFRIIKNV